MYFFLIIIQILTVVATIVLVTLAYNDYKKRNTQVGNNNSIKIRAEIVGSIITALTATGTFVKSLNTNVVFVEKPRLENIIISEQIELGCDVPFCDIYYSVNGENPKRNGILYDTPITIDTQNISNDTFTINYTAKFFGLPLFGDGKQSFKIDKSKGDNPEETDDVEFTTTTYDVGTTFNTITTHTIETTFNTDATSNNGILNSSGCFIELDKLVFDSEKGKYYPILRFFSTEEQYVSKFVCIVYTENEEPLETSYDNNGMHKELFVPYFDTLLDYTTYSSIEFYAVLSNDIRARAEYIKFSVPEQLKRTSLRTPTATLIDDKVYINISIYNPKMLYLDNIVFKAISKSTGKVIEDTIPINTSSTEYKCKPMFPLEISEEYRIEYAINTIGELGESYCILESGFPTLIFEQN